MDNDALLEALNRISESLVTIANAFSEHNDYGEPMNRAGNALEMIANAFAPDDDEGYGFVNDFTRNSFVNDKLKPQILQRLVSGQDRIARLLAELVEEWRDLAEHRSSSRG